MKKIILLKFRYILMMGIAVLFSACHDSKDPDTKAPNLVFDGLTENQIVRGTVSATIQATDNDKVDKVDVFIDSNLLTTLTTSPYEMSWNTNDVADGKHVVKIVATDKSGNETVVEVSVMVQNIILTAYAPQNQLATGDHGFIFLSDENGKFISGKEYANGETIVLKAPAFQGDKFYLTEATITLRNDGATTPYHVLALATYPGIARGEWKITFFTPRPRLVDVGNANLTFTNAASGYSYQLVSNSTNGAETVDGMNLSASIALLKSPSKLLIKKVNSSTGNVVGYKIIPQVVIGSNTAINLAAAYTAMTTVSSDNFPNATSLSLNLKAYSQAGDYSDEYSVGDYGNSDGSPISVAYPGMGFPSYYFESYVNKPNYEYESYSSIKFDLTPFNYTFEATYANSKINYTATGNFDHGIIYLARDFQYWDFYAPTGTGLSISVPELPSFISTIFSADFSKASLEKGMFDFAEYTSYGGMIEYLQSKKGDAAEIGKMGTAWKRTIIKSGAAGGRLQTNPSLNSHQIGHP